MNRSVSRRALCRALKSSLSDTFLAFKDPSISGKLSRYEMISVMASHPSLAQSLIDDDAFLKKLKPKEIARLGSRNVDFGMQVIKSPALHQLFTANDIAILGQHHINLAREIFSEKYDLLDKLCSVYLREALLPTKSFFALIKISKNNFVIFNELKDVIKRRVKSADYNDYLIHGGAYFPKIAMSYYNQEHFLSSPTLVEKVLTLGGRLTEIAQSILETPHLKSQVEGFTCDVRVNNQLVNATLWFFFPHLFCTANNGEVVEYNALYYALIVKILNEPEGEWLTSPKALHSVVGENHLDVMEYILQDVKLSEMPTTENLVEWIQINPSIVPIILSNLKKQSKTYVAQIPEYEFMKKTASILERPALAKNLSQAQRAELAGHVWVWERVRQACAPAANNQDVQVVERKMQKLKM